MTLSDWPVLTTLKLDGNLAMDHWPKPNHQIPANKNDIWDAFPTVMPNSSGFKTKTKQMSCNSTEPK